VGDHLGSTTLVVDTAPPPEVAPKVKYREYYKPYGEALVRYNGWADGFTPTGVGFTGQRLDDESGLMYFGARYYDPVLSMFVSADPSVPDAKHAMDYEKYIYVRGNPLRYIDELGYAPEDYYIFAEGCVPGSVSGAAAAGCGHPDWGEYTLLLKSEYAMWQ
jgi:RHS repeat-associated protein